jgi:FkbM family methyltransferase
MLSAPMLPTLNGTLRLRFQTFLRDRFGVEPKSPVRVSGYEIHFIRHRTLQFLLEEVWAAHEYYFEADCDRPLILDCGANIGAAVLYFKRLYPKARIIAFEPFGAAFEALAANVKANHLDDVTIYHALLAEKHGNGELFFNPDHLGSLSMSTRPDRIKGASQTVKAVPLSEYIDEPVDLLKMDIEGAELDVLRELAERGKLSFVKQMIIEYHHHILPDEDRLSQLLAILERHGFGYRIKGHYPTQWMRGQFQDLLVHAYSKQSE